MSKLTNYVNAFVILGTLISLYLLLWTTPESGFKDAYELDDEYTSEGQTMFQRLENLQLLKGVQDLQQSILKLNPSG